MKTWFKYLRRGLSRKLPEERLSSSAKNYDIKDNLKRMEQMELDANQVCDEDGCRQPDSSESLKPMRAAKTGLAQKRNPESA